MARAKPTVVNKSISAPCEAIVITTNDMVQIRGDRSKIKRKRLNGTNPECKCIKTADSENIKVYSELKVIVKTRALNLKRLCEIVKSI